MEPRNETDRRIEETLSALDNLTRTGPGPFFYTRVQARMQSYKRSVLDSVIAFLARPAVAVSMAVAVILFNGLVLIETNNSPNNPPNPNYDIALAEEFNPLQIVTFYDAENP